MENFWDNRFRNEKYAFGTEPSEMTKISENYFRENNVKNVLVMGVGYGRNGKYFTDKGYAVDGIELSEEAINIGKVFAPKINFINGSVLDINPNKRYDAVFCYDLMQLFLKDERETIINNCIRCCQNDGMIIISCLSTKDMLFNGGNEIEENSFEFKEGMTIHFSDEKEMKQINEKLKIIKWDYSIEIIQANGIRKERNRIYGIYKIN
jgi:2-polyprenyl-3-methyl-5-hydroxy-6-metoxy-1,4-benzoquinol methylase